MHKINPVTRAITPMRIRVMKRGIAISVPVEIHNIKRTMSDEQT